MANTVTFKTVYDAGAGAALTEIGATEKLYWQKAEAFAYGATGAIPATEYNGGFHIIDASNVELCDTGHPANLKYLTDSTVSINGAASANVNTITTAQCLNILVSCDPNAEVTAASFFAYDGTTETTAPVGLTVKGMKQGGAAWASIGGSAAALDLGTSASAAAHNYYVALSVSPASNGAKTGTLKASVTVV